MGKKSLYPGVLFHFTNKIETLKKILKDSFLEVSYAKEEVHGVGKFRLFGAPMVSFCDLRLSELGNHTKSYGGYGIGLSKEWAYKKGLNPVIYLNTKSPLINNFMDSLNGIYSNIESTENKYFGNNFEILNKSYHKILRIYMYTKNYEGDLLRKNGKLIKDYRFADDREWRYVSDNAEFVPSDKLVSDWKSIWNAKIKNRDLKFDLEDVAYIIIKSDEQRSRLVDHIEKILRGSCNRKVIKKLSSRIMTVEQMQRDV